MACYCYRRNSHLYIIARLVLRLLLTSRFFDNSVYVCVHLAPTSFLAIYGEGYQRVICQNKSNNCCAVVVVVKENSRTSRHNVLRK